MALHEAVRPLILYSGNELLDPQQQQRFQKVGGEEEWAILYKVIIKASQRKGGFIYIELSLFCHSL
jgi:hypothetical protein